MCIRDRNERVEPSVSASAAVAPPCSKPIGWCTRGLTGIVAVRLSSLISVKRISRVSSIVSDPQVFSRWSVISFFCSVIYSKIWVPILRDGRHKIFFLYIIAYFLQHACIAEV